MNPATAQEATPISMQEAVGYDAVDCRHQEVTEDALVLKHERLFLLLHPHGDIAPAGRCDLGLFYDDTRILSHYALRFAGGPASLLSAEAPRMYSAQVDLAISDEEFGGDPRDPTNSTHIRREILLDDRLTERVTLTNFLAEPIDFWMELDMGADFADIFEVRGWRRSGRGQFFRPAVTNRSILFGYRGMDGVVIRSAIRFFEPPEVLEQRRARWKFRLQPSDPVSIEWQVLPEPEAQGKADGTRLRLPERREPLADLYRGWRSECARWSTNVEEFDTALDQATVDLRALYVKSEGEDIVSAGIPWYSTPFGRDSLITSLQTVALNPRIARDTLLYLAHHQGRREDSFTEEQPGRIMHELRRGELARSGEIPHIPYYGTIDATPLWLILLHETWRWTGDQDLVRQLLPHAKRALDWIEQYGDIDGDGLVEYARTSREGLVNQGWKDSRDGVPFPDGSLPRGPIALVEVQGYVYDAKRRMAMLFDAFGEPERADRLRSEAEVMRERIHRRFWLPELGTFALALDGDKTPLPTATTNAGHLLWSRVPTDAQARRMADQLLGPNMFSGWGVRTLSATHRAFNPMSYHNGSVWPHDNAIVAMGLCLYGLTGKMLPILSAFHEAASGLRYHRLPELFCGMPRGQNPRPVSYPVSCSPQAWAAGAFFMMLQGATGLFPDAPAGVLHVREPELPAFMEDLTISGLRVGETRLTLQFRRLDGRTLPNLLHMEGKPLQVRIRVS